MQAQAKLAKQQGKVDQAAAELEALDAQLREAKEDAKDTKVEGDGIESSEAETEKSQSKVKTISLEKPKTIPERKISNFQTQ